MANGPSQFAAEALRNNDPTGWFEPLYAAAARGEAEIPWDADTPTKPLPEWVDEHGITGAGRRALVVGCGLGRDSEYIASLGFDTVAFDLSPTAIDAAKRRYPDSTVEYLVADLLKPPKHWLGAFDLVVESMTVQALPEPPRHEAIVNIGRFVAPGGTLIAFVRALVEGVTYDGPPWPVKREEMNSFTVDGLRPVVIDLLHEDDPHSPRWRAEFYRDPA